MIDPALALSMHRSFRSLQRRNRVVSRVPGSDLSLVESHLLVELHGSPDSRAQDFASLFRMNKSSISRMCAKLAAEGFLLMTPSESDPRRKDLVLTLKGRRVVQLMDREANAAVAVHVKRLGESSLGELVEFFETIATGLGEPPGAIRRNEHRYRLEQRRVTRAFGLLRDEVFGTGLSSLTYHLVSLLAESPVPLNVRSVANALSSPHNTVGVTVNGLVKKKWIERQENDEDKRQQLVTLTPLGRRMFTAAERAAGDQIARALAKSSTERAAAWNSFLTKFMAGDNLIQGTFLVERVREEGRVEARAFMIEQLVRLGRTREAPSRLFTPEVEGFTLREGSRIVAVCQFEGEDDWRLSSAVWDDELDQRMPLVNEFTRRSKTLLSSP